MRILFLAFFLLVAAVNPLIAQEASFPEGASVGLVPPEGLVPSARFSGFEDAAKGTSVVVTELPVEAYASIAAKFNKEGLEATGIAITSGPEEWPVEGAVVSRIVRGNQVAAGVRYRKWVVLIGAEKLTAMVTVQIPEGVQGGLSDEDVDKTLRSIRLRAPVTLNDQIATLPFKVADQAGFRPVRVIAGATLLLTEGPNDVAANSLQPVIIIASSLSSAPAAATRMEFAKQAFLSLTGIKDVQSDNETSSQAGEAEWIEIDGKATDSVSGDALYVAQVARFEAERYVRAILIVRESEKDKYASRFRTLAKSMTIN